MMALVLNLAVGFLAAVQHGFQHLGAGAAGGPVEKHAHLRLAEQVHARSIRGQGAAGGAGGGGPRHRHRVLVETAGLAGSCARLHLLGFPSSELGLDDHGVLVARPPWANSACARILTAI
eukprot:3989937-Pyramimonas_sp.AAC.1